MVEWIVSSKIEVLYFLFFFSLFASNSLIHSLTLRFSLFSFVLSRLPDRAVRLTILPLFMLDKEKKTEKELFKFFFFFFCLF